MSSMTSLARNVCEGFRMSVGIWTAGRMARQSPMWPAPLTARQLAVAEAVAEGKSNRQVAREQYITVKTVEYHVSQVFAKLGIDARADIAAALRSRKS